MTFLSSPQPPPTDAAPVKLESFFAQVGSINPFTDNRINSPAALEADATSVHAVEFDRLTAWTREAHEQQRGMGVMLWGEAGIGKSHLLARLGRWADRDRHACFLYLHNLQASAENLPRSLLKAVMSILTRGRAMRFHETRLFQIVTAFVLEAVRYDTSVNLSWSQLERAYYHLMQNLSAQDPSRAALVDRQVYTVLFHFFRSAYRASQGQEDGIAALAVRWLSGDYLDPDEASRTQLPPARGGEDAVALNDNQQIKQVLVALIRLAQSRQQPFLLCFDQVDNLDDDQMAALARFLEALIDSSTNLLVVTSGVQASLLHWRETKVIQDSAWDRLAQFTIALQRLQPREAAPIITARLEKFLTPFHDLEPVCVQRSQDHWFPLGEAWWQTFRQSKIEFRPREVVHGAREAWQRQQEALRQAGGSSWLHHWRSQTPNAVDTRPAENIEDSIDRKIDQKISEYVAQRCAAPDTLPPDAEHLAGLVYALLGQCRQADSHRGLVAVERFDVSSPRKRSPYHLILRRQQHGKEIRIGLLFLATNSKQSITGFLRRIVRARHAVERILIVTDERRPLTLGTEGEKYWNQLRLNTVNPCRHRVLPLDEYAYLNALQFVIGLARADDLEIETIPGTVRPLRAEEVIASHQRQDRYRASALLCEVLQEETSPSAERGTMCYS